MVIAKAHDTPVPGFRTSNTLNLRLWSSEPSTEFDLGSFNEGNYYKVSNIKYQISDISFISSIPVYALCSKDVPFNHLYTGIGEETTG